MDKGSAKVAGASGWAGVGLLVFTALAYAADTGTRTDPVDPACSQRDAPPEKCVIDDGPAPACGQPERKHP